MKKVLFVLLVIVAGCSDEEPKKESNYIIMTPHNSDGELYAGVPIQFNVLVPTTEVVTGVTWEFGDNTGHDDAHSAPKHYYNQPTLYKVTAHIQSNRRSFTQDTTVAIIQSPLTMGAAPTGERARQIHKTGMNSFAILYEVTDNTSVSHYKWMPMDGQLRGEGADQDFDTFPNAGPSATTADGKLCIAAFTELRIFTPGGARLDTYDLQRFSRDIRIDGDEVSILSDSADYAVVTTVNLSKREMKSVRHPIAVQGMVFNGLFFNEPSGFFAIYTDNTSNVTLLKGFESTGDPASGDYFHEPNFIRNITPVSGGVVVNGYVDDNEALRITKLDRENNVQWTKDFPTLPSYNRVFLGDETVIKEFQGYLYIFFDNMRCIKMAEDGGVVWDRFFYSDDARLNAVTMTENGAFIMIGTRQFNPNGSPADFMQERDVVVIKMDPEGRRF